LKLMPQGARICSICCSAASYCQRDGVIDIILGLPLPGGIIPPSPRPSPARGKEGLGAWDTNDSYFTSKDAVVFC
jgi:hypothetical protein